MFTTFPVSNRDKILIFLLSLQNLFDMLKYYLKHQEEVVTRRTRYDLNKAEERAHILQGLLKALDHIDEVIKIIRASKSTADAKEKLIERFDFDDVQAQAIVDMRLRALTGLEREKLENEHKELKLQNDKTFEEQIKQTKPVKSLAILRCINSST